MTNNQLRMAYERDIFYDIRTLPLEDKVKIIQDAKDACREWWVDELNCSISWSRRRIKMSYEDVMKKYDQKCHTVVILRRGSDPDQYYGEVGFTTMKGVDHFLWVILDVDKLMEIVDKHKLKPQNS